MDIKMKNAYKYEQKAVNEAANCKEKSIKFVALFFTCIYGYMFQFVKLYTLLP